MTLIYLGHSIDDKGSIYISCYQATYLQHNRIDSPRVIKLDSSDGSMIWKYQDFEDGNVTNPVVSPNSMSLFIYCDLVQLLIVRFLSKCLHWTKLCDSILIYGFC
jgi:hypothetical protein